MNPESLKAGKPMRLFKSRIGEALTMSEIVNDEGIIDCKTISIEKTN